MTEFLSALGLAIVIEGVFYAFFPDAMKRMMQVVLEQPPQNLRAAGMTAVLLGLGLIWLVRA